MSGGGESCYLEGVGGITGGEVWRVEGGDPKLLLDSTLFFSAAIFSAVAAASIKGGGGGRWGGDRGRGICSISMESLLAGVELLHL